MNQDDCSIQTIFGEVYPSRQKLQDRRANYSPIDFKFSYINNLRVPITIKWKSGFSFVLPPAPVLSENRLVMRMEIVIQESVRQSVASFFTTVGKDSSPELQALREAYETQSTNYHERGVRLILDYPISLDQLKQHGGSVYHSDLDIVISLFGQDDAPHHPYSEEGKRSQLVVGSPDDGSFGYSVHMIDNAGKEGARFLNISNKVYKVTGTKDPSLRDGVYVTSNRFVMGDQMTRDIVSEYHSLDGVEETLGLYRTYDEAYHFGDLAAGRKADLTNLEYQLQENKLNLQAAGLELQSAKEAHEIAMMEKNRELKELQLKHEAEVLKETKLREKAETESTLKRQETKDFYEARSYQRKDDSEAVKFLPAIIVGIGAVFMAVKSFFK